MGAEFRFWKTRKGLEMDGGEGCTTMYLMPLAAHSKIAKMIKLCHVHVGTVNRK